MSQKQRYYFDANALWKFYKPGREEKGSVCIRRLVSSVSVPILVSPLTVLELVGTLMRRRRQGILKQRSVNKVVSRLKQDIKLNTKIHHFELIAMPQGSFHTAEYILLQHAKTFAIGSNDALHLAIAAKLQAHFPIVALVTSDNSMQKVCEKMQILFHDPENIA